MRTIATFNAFHLGDNLVHLNFLRRCALAHPDITFTHTCEARHFAQLSPLLLGLPANNLQLGSAPAPAGAINAWRGAGGHWYSHPHRHDFATYHLDWFAHLAERMGLESPIKTASDLLFDYPALENKSAKCSAKHDFLIINAAPNSGQWAGFSCEAFDQLIERLHEAGKSIITTHPSSSVPSVPSTISAQGDVTCVGKVSQIATCIIGCVTGPMWPTLNIWNRDTVKLRIHLLDSERVELTPNTVHANSLSLVPEILRDHGLL